MYPGTKYGGMTNVKEKHPKKSSSSFVRRFPPNRLGRKYAWPAPSDSLPYSNYCVMGAIRQEKGSKNPVKSNFRHNLT